jgi:ADP-L-glycero-D-manno-heptose 6-epimerase
MILVTGGAGFIGSNIVAELNERGITDIAICDRLRDGTKWLNVAKRAFRAFVAPGDLSDWLAKQTKLDAIIHMGAISATTETDGDAIIANNLNLSLQLLDWCAATNTPFLYASSAATYGDGDLGFSDQWSQETLEKLRPLNLYGWSKHAFDKIVSERAVLGLPLPDRWAGFKFFNVFGPNENHKGGMKSVVATLYPQAAAGETVTLFKSHRDGIGDGEQARDFVWVEDVSAVAIWFFEAKRQNGLYNIGTGQARTFKDLTLALFKAVNQPTTIAYRDTPVAIRDKYQYFTQAELSGLKQAGFDRAWTPLEDAVERYVKRYLATGDDRR